MLRVIVRCGFMRGGVEMIGDPIEVTEAYAANKNREPVA